MNRLCTLIILAGVSMMLSCTDYHGLKSKKHWSNYRKMSGTKNWRVFRFRWATGLLAYEERKNWQKIYDFRKEERIASIGADLGTHEIIYSIDSPVSQFYLEDIDEKRLLPRNGTKKETSILERQLNSK